MWGVASYHAAGETDGSPNGFGRVSQPQWAKIGASERRALSAWRKKTPYTNFNFEEMHLAGVFPPDRATLDRFASKFSAGCGSMDLLAAWGGRQERRFLEEFCPDTTLCRRTDLDEPYYFSDPWSSELAGKRVLVVSPFVDSITRQYARRGAVWPGSRVLPSFDLMTLAMPHSDALVPSRYGSWFEMCDDLVQRALNMEFDAALIGAGAASLLLCLSFKKAGKFAIHLGGATQILFGITGKRWDTDPTISKLQNQSWIRPSPAETPTKSYKVERGAYW
jgi:hypothetical protein